MLDERWSQDADQIGEALRRMLSTESSIARVRSAENTPDGRDLELESQLRALGLIDLPPDPVIAAGAASTLDRIHAPLRGRSLRPVEAWCENHRTGLILDTRPSFRRGRSSGEPEANLKMRIIHFIPL